MNKRQVIASLNEIANELDNNGMFNEANEIIAELVHDHRKQKQFQVT